MGKLQHFCSIFIETLDEGPETKPLRKALGSVRASLTRLMYASPI